MRLMHTLISSALASLLVSSAASAVTPQDAQTLKAGIAKAKSVVDRAISAAGGSGQGGQGGGQGGGGFPSGGGFPGGFPGGGNPHPNPGGHGSFFVDDDAQLESDFLALPIFNQASGSLFDAGHFSDIAILDLLGGNIQQGVFEFSQACARMGIGRSQIARANIAALQPPVGLLAPFGSELADVVIELNALRNSAHCP